MDFDLIDMYMFNKYRQASQQPGQPVQSQPAPTSNNIVGFEQVRQGFIGRNEGDVTVGEMPVPSQPSQPQPSQPNQAVFKVKKSTKHPDSIQIGGSIEYFEVKRSPVEVKVEEHELHAEEVKVEEVKAQSSTRLSADVVKDEPTKVGRPEGEDEVKSEPKANTKANTKARRSKGLNAYHLFVKENISKESGPSRQRMKKLGQMWREQQNENKKV